MYEFHGWATIRETAENVEYNEDALEQIVETLQGYIDEVAWKDNHVSGILDLRLVNGAYHVWAAGFTNHKSREIDELFEFFRYIARMAPGSYGLLYVYDDEDTSGCANKFNVYRLVRGEFHEHDDPFLSPFVPTIESE